MSGLIQKDMCLLLQRSRTLVVLIGVALLMGMSTDGAFVIGYLTVLCAILTIGTISYDEYDNGYPFLMTLPITKKTYVTGKFLFCLLGGLIGWVISGAIYIVCCFVKESGFSASNLGETIAFLPVLCLMIAVMLPMQLKFGAEKSRVVLAIAAGGIWVLAFFTMRFIPSSGSMPAFLEKLHGGVLAALLLGLCLATLAVSWRISMHIMEKKEL